MTTTTGSRPDFSHLYDFELPDGAVVGFPDTDFGEDHVLDHTRTKVAALLKPGHRFGYRFDFGDEWIRECMVQPEKVDPVHAYGEVPANPVPIFGWGTIPDQYGRLTDGSDDETQTEPEIPFPFLHHEIERLIELNNRKPMSTADLANSINQEGRYLKKDGSPITSSHVSTRTRKYPALFERTEDGHIGLRRRDR